MTRNVPPSPFLYSIQSVIQSLSFVPAELGDPVFFNRIYRYTPISPSKEKIHSSENRLLHLRLNRVYSQLFASRPSLFPLNRSEDCKHAGREKRERERGRLCGGRERRVG